MGIKVRSAVVLCALAILAAAAVVVFAARHAYSIYDDAYIFFHYAENFFRGCPFQYNCSEAPVEGFSSPLYLGLLVVARFFTSDLESASQIIGVLALCATFVVVLSASRDPVLVPAYPDAKWVVPVVVVALLALDDYVLLNAVVGMETAVAMLVVTLVFRAALDAPHRGLRVAVSLAVVCRAEFMLFALLLPILPACRRLRFLAPLAAFIAVVVVARLIIFGDLFPNTVHAKAGGTAGHLALGLEYLAEALRDFPVALVALSALLLRHRAATYFLGIFLIVAASFFWSGGDIYFYSRFVVPFVPVLTLLSVVGLWSVASRVRSHSPHARWMAPAIVSVAGAIFFARNLYAHSIDPVHGLGKVERMAQAGRFLAANFPGSRVATAIAGTVAYFSKCEVLDIVGLTNRAIGKSGNTVPPDRLIRKSLGHERHATDVVFAWKPDIIVTVAHRDRPWPRGERIEFGVYAELLIAEAIQSGRAPYRPWTPEVAPGLFWFMFVRGDFIKGHRASGVRGPSRRNATALSRGL